MTTPAPNESAADRVIRRDIVSKELQAFREVNREFDSAREKFPAFNSSHEGYAVILEELDELWEEVRMYPHSSKELLRKEAMQIAAMAIRFMVDLT